MLGSYVAGEGVELTLHKESVVVGEIKEVELRSRRSNLFIPGFYIQTPSKTFCQSLDTRFCPF